MDHSIWTFLPLTTASFASSTVTGKIGFDEIAKLCELDEDVDVTSAIAVVPALGPHPWRIPTWYTGVGLSQALKLAVARARAAMIVFFMFFSGWVGNWLSTLKTIYGRLDLLG